VTYLVFGKGWLSDINSSQALFTSKPLYQIFPKFVLGNNWISPIFNFFVAVEQYKGGSVFAVIRRAPF
jgi:hypothetical protein